MKRDRYEIKVGSEIVDVRSKWNACIRSIEDMIGKIAREEGQDYSLVEKESIKEDFGFARGFRTWEGSKDKTRVKFKIEKIS